MSTFASNVPEFREDVATLSKSDKISATGNNNDNSNQQQQGSWSDPGVRPAAAVNIISGMTYGISIGFLPSLFAFNKFLGDCSRYTTSGACDQMTFANCQWLHNHSTCAFPDYSSVNCSNQNQPDSCAGAYDGSTCLWDQDDNICKHDFGWSAQQTGMLAAAQIVGSMIASAVAGPVTNKLGRKRTLGLCATLVTLACCLITIAWLESEAYFTLLVGEIVIGAADGVLSVVAPLYNGEVSAEAMQSSVGVLFQLSVASGIAISGAFALIIDPSKDTYQPNEYLQERFLTMIALQWVTAFLLFLVAFCVPESPIWQLRKLQKAGGGASSRDTEEACCDDFCPDDDDEEASLLHGNNSNNNNDTTSSKASTHQPNAKLLRHSGYAASSIRGSTYRAPSVVGGVVTFHNHDSRKSHHHHRRRHQNEDGTSTYYGGTSTRHQSTAAISQTRESNAHNNKNDDDTLRFASENLRAGSLIEGDVNTSPKEDTNIKGKKKNVFESSYNNNPNDDDEASPLPSRNTHHHDTHRTVMTGKSLDATQSILYGSVDTSISQRVPNSYTDINNNNGDDGYHVERTQSATRFDDEEDGSNDKKRSYRKVEQKDGYILKNHDEVTTQAGDENIGDDETDSDEEEESNSFKDLFVRENAGVLFVGVVIAACLQLTGINGIIIFAPNIVKKIGIAPLLGSFLVALLNLCSTFVPIFLVKHIPCRLLFTFCCFGASISMLMASLGVWPGVLEKASSAEKGVTLAGIALFIIFFENIGATFYVIISSSISPARVRSLFVSFCVNVAFFFNLLVNFGFPIAVEAFSGGPNGDQNKGLAIVFLIFASTGFVCATFLAFKMPKSE